MTQLIPKWADVTREERFFTSVLFHALLADKNKFWARLRPLLKLPDTISVEDVGFEVCLLRDLAHAKHIERVVDREKQTFDLILTLSNNALVLIEAKAHQGFSRKQLDLMRSTGKHLINKSFIKEVYYAGIHSSKYSPDNVRSEYEKLALLTWRDLASDYDDPIRIHLKRADEIYRN